jgi:hypothetical protein
MGIKMYGAVGSCYVRGVMDENNVLRLQILPYSPVATGNETACFETTDEFCGPIIGAGCVFQPTVPLPRAKTKYDPAPASSEASVPKGDGVSGDKDGGGSNKARNTVLLGVSISFLMICVLAVAAWFIVLPWCRGATSSSDDSFENCAPRPSISSNGHSHISPIDGI